MVYNIFIKTNSPSALNRNCRISKSELYRTLNHLVNMIALLEYFPTIISVCIWNKLYARFYLKYVMHMSLFKFLNEGWFVKFYRGSVDHEEIAGIN